MDVINITYLDRDFINYAKFTIETTLFDLVI